APPLPQGAGFDRQLFSLPSFFSIIDIDIDGHRPHIHLRKSVKGKVCPIVPVFPSPFHVLQIFCVIYMTHHVDLCRAYFDGNRCLHHASTVQAYICAYPTSIIYPLPVMPSLAGAYGKNYAKNPPWKTGVTPSLSLLYTVQRHITY